MSVFSRLLGPGGDAPWDFLIRTVDGSEFNTHRSFLCGASPFFRAALGPEYDSSKWLLLKGVSAAELGVILEYYYMGELRIDNNNVTEVLAVADMLLMDEARDLCLDYLWKNIDIDNCLGMAQLAQGHHWPRFHDNVFSFVREHFDAVWRSSSEFLEAPTSLLVELFSSSELNVRNEVDLLYAIRRWFTRSRASAADREASLPLFLQCARIGLCSETTFILFRQLCPTFAKTRAYRVAVRGDLRRGPCKCSASILLLMCSDELELQVCITLGAMVSESGYAVPSSNTERWTPNRAIAALLQFPCMDCTRANPERWLPRVPHEMLFMVGGLDSRAFRGAVEAYDPRASCWLLHTMYKTSPRAFHGVVLAGKFVYVMGGKQGNVYLRSCDRFDTERCVWEPCSAMHVARSYVAAAFLSNYIYAAGGENAFGCTATVERFNPTSNSWTTVPPMYRARSGCSACAFRGKLYVSGGYDGSVMLSSVEVFTPSSETWLVVQRMPGPRCCHRMTEMNGRIYIVGGYDGYGQLSTMIANKMDGALSTWQQMTPMHVARSSFAVAQLYGELYVIGGLDGRFPTAEVECYSPAKDIWRFGVPLTKPVSAMAACCVRGIAFARRLAIRGAMGLSS